ncbi:MAG: hypothetical protein KGI54_16110 [Pseudomonadota bacterium]|nr:hypothetical protein [Pseudomonadota bacterium]
MTNHPNRRRIAKYNDALVIGDTAYLIRYENLNTGATEFRVQVNEPVTNMSREVRLEGWLGTTNNVSAYAMGVVELTKWGAKPDEVHFKAVKQ